ncbi:MAG: LytR C-terminal domain-containing protein [Candidatus Zixiibacteriota bacterium]|nr:MAG: LytR C-terminal domain-containing protein [candidate division Zixibacteria bacterium]
MVSVSRSGALRQLGLYIPEAIRRAFRRFSIEILCGLVLAVTLAYFLSLTWKTVTGETYSAAVPEHQVRLQIVNASAAPESPGEVRRLLQGFVNADLQMEKVVCEDLRIREITESLVISRIADPSSAERLAELLNIDPGRVYFRPLDRNRDQISVTLVLGGDYQEVIKAAQAMKENTGTL